MFSSYGFFRRKTENISINEKPSIKINKTGNFSDGVAWITYNDEIGTEQLALIDTSGKILYKETNKCVSLPSEMHGVSYMNDKENNYKLITKEGNIVANSQDGAFDSVLAYGDGLALVYKFSGPKDSKHLYGVIDNNGQLILDYMEFSKKTIAEYMGCGIFAIELSDRTLWAIVNCNTGSHIFIGTKYLSSLPKFVNNSAYFTPNYYIFENPFDSLLQATQMSYCRLDTNFNISTTSEFQYSSNSLLVTFDGGYGNPISIINPKTNNKYTLDYNTTQLISLEYVDNLGLLKIKAADNNTYFTLLDTQGKEQFDPIVYNGTVNYADKKVVYKINEIYNIIDIKGNVLSENLEYTTINEFSEDIAVAITTFDEYCFINSKGKKVLQDIHE